MRRIIDGWVLALAAFFGLLATVGLGLSITTGLLAAVGTAAAGTAATALAARRTTPPALPPAGPPAAGGPGLPGSEQLALLTDIEDAAQLLSELAADTTLVPAVVPKAQEADILASTAVATARRVTEAADRVSAALAKIGAVGDSAAMSRLAGRHAQLCDRLRAADEQLVAVYTDLVETNALLGATSVLSSGEEQALQSVATSLDDLRTIAADLEAADRTTPA